jgi:hypothetical protein
MNYVFSILLLLTTNNLLAGDTTKTKEVELAPRGHFLEKVPYMHNWHDQFIWDHRILNKDEEENSYHAIEEFEEKFETSEERLREIVERSSEKYMPIINDDKFKGSNNHPKKGTTKYKEKMDCLLSERTAQECDALFNN